MRIAISGLAGCGATTTCALVAKALRLKAISFTFRHLANELGLSFEDVCARAKRDDRYDLLLDQRLLSLTERGGFVIASRLACWLCDANLRVWLHAPQKVRAARVAQREKISYAAALRDVRRRDASDAKRYKRLYGIDLTKAIEVCDLIINNERISANQVAKIVVETALALKSRRLVKSPWRERIRRIIKTHN